MSVKEKFRREFLAVMKENHWPTIFCMGVVTFYSATENGDEAIKQADSEMYRAKNNGKNKTEFTEA